MDEEGIESKGVAPLKPELDAIAAIADKRSLARVIGGTLRADVDPLNATNFQTENLFGVWIAQGLNDPEHNTPYLLQGGLGLPDRDYYVSTSPKMAELRAQYTRHVAAILGPRGIPAVAGPAARIVDLETKIAAVHATRVQSADVGIAQVWKREALAEKAPGVDWSVLLEAAGLNNAPTFIVWHPAAVTGLSALVAKAPLDVWKDWLAFHAVNQVTGFLPKAFVDEGFRSMEKRSTARPAASAMAARRRCDERRAR
jgi:Predicted metalloendopeptidase